MEEVAVQDAEVTAIRLTQTQCLFQHRVEYRREVAWRGIDDLQNLTGRRLLFERFASLGD